MKITCSNKKAGSVLVTTLMISACIGIVLAGTIVLVSNRNLIDQRSQAWNTAMPVLEAGIEEAFTHLVDDSNLTSNSWTRATNNGQVVYLKTRNFTNNGTYCNITLSNVSATSAVIYSQGYVPVPYGSGGYISRLVQVIATNPSPFHHAVASRGPITLSGGAVVDSFNSSNPLYSTGGMYDPSKREANGGVVTDSTANPAIKVSSANIYGQTDTGPTGTVTTSGSGGVGGLGWSTGVEAGYANNDMNTTFPDQVAPAGSAGWTPPISGSYLYNGTNFTYDLGSGGYTQTGSFSMSGGQSLLVTGNVTLYVTGNISISGQSYIYLAPGSSLTLVGGGPTTSLSGGGIVNGTGIAANFSYIGLPANTSVGYSGGADFIGTINAPEADFSISGGANMYGAAIVNSFTDSGGSAIHYDESLGGSSLYIMTSYTEL